MTLLCDVMRRRLQTWCTGLIEVPDFIWNRVNALDAKVGLRTKITWDVTYLHRTARDFIESNLVWGMLLKHTSNTDFNAFTSLLNSTVLLYKVAGKVVSNPLGYGLFRKELLEPASHAMLYAQRAEAITGDSYLVVLGELDKVMDRHLIRWTGDYVGHWSRFLNVAAAENTLFSFVDLAIFFGLHQYVLSKIASDHAQYLREYELQKDENFLRDYFKEDESDPERPVRATTLLDVAVRPGCPGSKMAHVLLEHGADANETSGYQGVPTWEHVLKRAEYSCKRNSEGEKWLQIIEVFLQYNVDLRGSYKDADDARRHVFAVIVGFRAKYPDQVAALWTMVDKQLPGSKGKRLKLWAREKLGSKETSHSPLRPLT